MSQNTVSRFIHPGLPCFLLLVGLSPGAVPAQEAPGSQLGPEHSQMAGYAGEWSVHPAPMDPEMETAGAIGTAIARTRLGGRFLEIQVVLDSGPFGRALYTLGFDARHREYQVVLMDDSGTYFVTARGGPSDGRSAIKMYGKDDDPVMTSMGLEKEFVIVVEFESPDRFSIGTLFIDTRTPERNEVPFLRLELRREQGD